MITGSFSYLPAITRSLLSRKTSPFKVRAVCWTSSEICRYPRYRAMRWAQYTSPITTDKTIINTKTRGGIASPGGLLPGYIGGVLPPSWPGPLVEGGPAVLGLDEDDSASAICASVLLILAWYNTTFFRSFSRASW